MNVRDFECRSYERAMELLGGKDRKTICNNTVLEARGSIVAVRLHGNCIVSLLQDGPTILYSCGFRTNTTKDRINRCLPGDWVLRSFKGEWWLWRFRSPLSSDMSTDKVPFVDGMTVPGTEVKA